MRFGKIHFGNQYLKAIGHGFQKPWMLCEGPEWNSECDYLAKPIGRRLLKRHTCRNF